MTSDNDPENGPEGQLSEKVLRLVLAGVGVSVLWALGVISTLHEFQGIGLNVAGLGASMAIAALLAFLVFYRAADIRIAVTAAFVTLYLGFVVACMVPGAASTLEKSGSFAHTIWDSLSALMIAIVGFYFGGKAVEISSAHVGKKSRQVSEVPAPSDEEPSNTD